MTGLGEEPTFVLRPDLAPTVAFGNLPIAALNTADDLADVVRHQNTWNTPLTALIAGSCSSAGVSRSCGVM